MPYLYENAADLAGAVVRRLDEVDQNTYKVGRYTYVSTKGAPDFLQSVKYDGWEVGSFDDDINVRPLKKGAKFRVKDIADMLKTAPYSTVAALEIEKAFGKNGTLEFAGVVRQSGLSDKLHVFKHNGKPVLAVDRRAIGKTWRDVIG